MDDSTMGNYALAVIGAGIQGLSVAYHCAISGISPIIVVEKSHVGSGSSGRSASMLMLQRENEVKIELSKYSYERFMDFSDEFGIDPQFEKIGFLSVASEQSKNHALQMAALRSQLGVRTEVLTQSEIGKLAPVVNTSDISVGVFGPDDGVIDAKAIISAYSLAAKRLGVIIREDVHAIGLDVHVLRPVF